MSAAATDDRQYWRDVVLAGSSTPLPRWSLGRGAGTSEHSVPLPDALETALHGLAHELEMPLRTLLLGSTAKVMSVMTGDLDVTVGIAVKQHARPLPCALSMQPASWRDLLVGIRRAESELLSYQEFPVAEVARELGLNEPTTDVVFDVVGRDEDLDAEVLRIEVSRRTEPLTLRFRYRTDAVDQTYAARLAGYHIRALEVMVEDVDLPHRQPSLVDSTEALLQLDGMAGPARELPDLRVHELFEQQVERHPDAIAATCAGEALTYRELNARANQLARALVDRGVGREQVVAVVTERHLDWMAAVLATFKAGVVYLPIEPHFPADRIAKTLSRASCTLVLTEVSEGGQSTLEAAAESLPGVRMLYLHEVYQQGYASENVRFAVDKSQLAYIYFTSGSTGEPKGAMCEQLGMLNHIYAKIDDLGIRENSVVAQTAPQCFDISLWQLLSALLVGGRTHLVEQETILDVERFVEQIADQHVEVLQIVPSYLEAVLSHLEARPRELPDLRCVSVTGEALKKDLAERWFAVEPGIRLVNAYGLTETSDDTNHEVMAGPPAGAGVPLGRPINNVHVYVVDEGLNLVPLGASGEIVFSGICVGRGYVNDPDRTRLAFMADPHRPGERLYRSGDFGRWRPDGKLEFLGRRDTQVKVSGFRIEIDEIENRLVQVPRVRAGAVIVAEPAGETKHLVGFYSAERPLDAALIRRDLAQALPAYMVPARYHWLEGLPLTDNGKVDRKVLLARAAELHVNEAEVEGPATPNERRLVSAWAKVLGIPEGNIGRHDHFFDRGGTSLTAVKLAIALDRAVSINDVARHPVLADQAELLVTHE